MGVQETMTIMLTTEAGSKPQPVEVPRQVGSVRVGELLGEGAGGAVFVGFDEALRRNVAVKVLHRQERGLTQAATHELVEGIRSAARVKHPNVVVVHHVATVAQMPVIVMEYVDGISLRELFQRAERLDLPLGLFVLRAVVGGVAALHEADIVHRDLKPANILLDRSANAFVVDFGLACRMDATTWASGLSQVAGSPLYMAPEAFEGHASPQGDVYALGVMLFQALAGKPPFSGTTLEEVKKQHINDEVSVELLEAAGVPDEVGEVVLRAMHKQRIMRYKSARHLLRALDDLPLPPTREDDLRNRLIRLISATPESRAARRSPAEDTPSMTTFDLVARRAREKRDQRGS